MSDELKLCQGPKCHQYHTKDRLKDNTQELVDRGGFGSPTFFLNENKMYFGQDRILLIESQL